MQRESFDTIIAVPINPGTFETLCTVKAFLIEKSFEKGFPFMFRINPFGHSLISSAHEKEPYVVK